MYLITRIQEHFKLNSAATSANKNHEYSRSKCIQNNFSVHYFTVLKQWYTNYETKIQEAFLVKKLNPKLHGQKFDSGSLFLLMG